MIWNIVSFFLSHEKNIIELNTNILETNFINLGILMGILIYGNEISIKPTLDLNQKEIRQTIENAQKDILNALNSYSLAEEGFLQNIFWLQSWKSIYKEEKTEIVTKKYNIMKNGFLEIFKATENLIFNLENQFYLSLQSYIIFITASRILRKFLFLSKIKQSKLIQVIFSKLGKGGGTIR